MNQNTQSDLGKLILRIALGVLVLLHGIAKLKGGVSGDRRHGRGTRAGPPYLPMAR